MIVFLFLIGGCLSYELGYDSKGMAEDKSILFTVVEWYLSRAFSWAKILLFSKCIKSNDSIFRLI